MPKHKKKTCAKVGLKRNGRLKKGFRWMKGRKGCPVKAKAKK